MTTPVTDAVTQPVVSWAMECMVCGDGEGLCELFASDGVVEHEGVRHQGRAAIAAWFAALPAFVLRPLHSIRQDGVHIVDADVEGPEPGKAQRHRFRFDVAEHEIRSMSVNVVR